MAGFASDALHVGTTGSALATVGIANAFANAAQLYNLSTSRANTPALTVTPNGNGTVPLAEINSLADSLAACVNQDPSTGTACSTLFANAKSNGLSGTTPTDTATAAINIAHNPAPSPAAVLAIFGNSVGIGAPYNPQLTATPNDWTISLAFSGGGLSPTSSPYALAVDASGNLSTAAGGAAVLSEFSPMGVPANALGFGGIGLNIPNSVALDVNSTHVWLANAASDDVSDFHISGGTAVSFGTGVGSSPTGAALDASGNVWVADFGLNTVVELNGGNGTLLNTLTGNGLSSPGMVAFEPGTGSDVWVADQAGTASLFTAVGGSDGNPSGSGTLASPFGPAIDAGGNAWFPDAYSTNIVELNSIGVTAGNFTLGTINPSMNSMAIDGNGNVWITDCDFDTDNPSDNTVYELNNSGSNLSPTAGFAPTPATAPDAIVTDASGNVWYTSQSDSLLHELVGAAAPTTVPIAFAVATTKLGTRP